MKLLNRFIVLSCLTLVIAGCGEKKPATFPVTGTVTLDGKAVEGAQITFVGEPPEKSAATVTKADGSYEMATFDAGDGALPGSYKIMVTKYPSDPGGPSPYGNPPVESTAPVEQSAEAISEAYGKAYSGPPKKGAPPKAPANELPMKYASTVTSGLTFTVEEKPNKFDIQLKSK
jgi:predicted small lipoprotein YifL